MARAEQGRLGARNDYERLQKQSSAEIAQLNAELQKLLHSKAATDAKAENLQALHHSVRMPTFIIVSSFFIPAARVGEQNM